MNKGNNSTDNWTNLSKAGSKYNAYIKDGFDVEFYNMLNGKPPKGRFEDWVDLSEFTAELGKQGFMFNFGIQSYDVQNSTTSQYFVNFHFIMKDSDFGDSSINMLSNFFIPRLSNIENISINSCTHSGHDGALKISLFFGEIPKGKFSRSKVDVTNDFTSFISSIFNDELLKEESLEFFKLSTL